MTGYVDTLFLLLDAMYKFTYVHTLYVVEVKESKALLRVKALLTLLRFVMLHI